MSGPGQRVQWQDLHWAYPGLGVGNNVGFMWFAFKNLLIHRVEGPESGCLAAAAILHCCAAIFFLVRLFRSSAPESSIETMISMNILFNQNESIITD